MESDAYKRKRIIRLMEIEWVQRTKSLPIFSFELKERDIDKLLPLKIRNDISNAYKFPQEED